MCNYQDEFKCCEQLCCTSEDKVQQVQKGAHAMLDLQLRDLYQQWISEDIENRRYHDKHQDQNIKWGRKSRDWGH